MGGRNRINKGREEVRKKRQRDRVKGIKKEMENGREVALRREGRKD